MSGKALIEPIVLVHGGAATIPDSRDNGKLTGCRLATKLGYETLQSTGSAVDAVEAAVRSMELNEYFNAGYGSILNYDGNVEMDAGIMDGRTLNAGGCTLVTDILHPISLAKSVMLNCNHTFLGGKSVMEFARKENFEILPPGSLVTEFTKQALDEFKRKKAAEAEALALNDLTKNGNFKEGVGTVGAVAIDKDGNVAAATSTGGTTGKMPGRIGDSPIFGSGTYADNNMGTVSITGNGDKIMRFNVAQRILQRMHLLNESSQLATEHVLEDLKERLASPGGAIVLSPNGEPGIYHTSKKMAWAYRKGNKVYSGIRLDEQFEEDA